MFKNGLLFFIVFLLGVSGSMWAAAKLPTSSAVGTSVILSTSKSNVDDGKYSLSWRYDGSGGGGGFGTFSNKAPSSNFALIGGGVPSGVSLYENGVYLANVKDKNNHHISGKTDGVYNYYIKDCSLGYCIQSNTVSVRVKNNFPPTISSITVPAFNEDSNSSTVTFRITDSETNASSLQLTSRSMNQNLIPDSGIKFGGTGEYRTIRLTPKPNAYGTTYLNVTVTDGVKSASRSVAVSVKSVNDKPYMSAVSFPTISEDSNTGSISLTIGDVETRSELLSLTATSSNSSLVDSSGILLTGSGQTRAIKLTPKSNRYGQSTITLTLSDGSDSISRTVNFKVNAVNDRPTLVSSHSSLNIDEDSQSGPITLTLGDVDNSAASLVLTKSSDNTTLLPESGILVSGTGSSRTVYIRPNPNRFGNATVTFGVSDGSLAQLITLSIIVDSINDKPVISLATRKTIHEDESLQGLAFSVSDIETSGSHLQVAATSDNQSLLPDSRVSMSGTGDNRALTLIPFENASGVANVTVSVSDGHITSYATLELTVNAVNDAPTISSISDQEILEVSSTVVFDPRTQKYLVGYALGPIPVSTNDVDNLNSSLELTVTSSNEELVRSENIKLERAMLDQGTYLVGPVYNGSSDGMNLFLHPEPHKWGYSEISITVSDGEKSATEKFMVKVIPVNQKPTISHISDISGSEDSQISSDAFSINDQETPVEDLIITFSSSNSTLIDSAGISLEKDLNGHTLLLNPKNNESGESLITIMVSDGELETSNSFTITVHPVLDRVSINEIGVIQAYEDELKESIEFSFIDNEEIPHDISISLESHNTDLLPNQNFTVHYDSNSLKNSTALKTATFDFISAQDQFGVVEVDLYVTYRLDSENMNSKNSGELRVICPESILPGNDCIVESVRRLEINIAPVNDPPIISGKPEEVAHVGHVFQYIPTASDVEGDLLTFGIANKPNWASFNTNTGLLMGTPSSDHIGEYKDIVISVTDGKSPAVSLPPFSINVKFMRKTVFIHTDLLGSPIVETDENGDFQ